MPAAESQSAMFNLVVGLSVIALLILAVCCGLCRELQRDTRERVGLFSISVSPRPIDPLNNRTPSKAIRGTSIAAVSVSTPQNQLRVSERLSDSRQRNFAHSRIAITVTSVDNVTEWIHREASTEVLNPPPYEDLLPPPYDIAVQL